ATATDKPLLQITDGDKAPPGPYGPGSPPYDFGTAGGARDAMFTLTNWGGAPATMIADGATLGSGLGNFGWTGNVTFGGGTCTTPTTLNAGASCTVGVTFTPSGDGARAGTLSISYSDGAATQVAVRALAGTATSKALLNIYDWTGPSGPD